MAAIASNGTGGGVASAGASWTGGVAPAEGDTCTIASGDTITIDANWTVGADSATPAIDVLNGGTLDWDGLGAADVVTCKGDFYVRNGGTLTLDGTADVTKTLTIRLNYSAALADGKYGMICENGSIITVTGFNKTRSWDTLSADAAALQKVCVTTNDNSAVWYAADEFVVGSMTKNAAAGAEADTIGSFAGTSITKAGANYTYKHDQNVAIINLTRNIIFTSHDVTKAGYILNYSTTAANFAMSWIRFTYLGYNSAGKYGVSWNSAAVRGTLDYCVFDNSESRSLSMEGIVGTGITHTGNVFYKNATGPYVTGFGSNRDTFTQLAALSASSYLIRSIGGIILSSFSMGNAQYTVEAGTSYTLFSTGRVYGCSVNGLKFYLSSSHVMDSILFDGNSIALAFGVSVAATTGNSLSFDIQVANTTHANVLALSFADVSLLRCNTIALTITFDATALPGSRINVSDTSANHKTWDLYGTFAKSNAVPRTGTYSMLMSPTNTSNALIAESAVPASSGVQVVVSAYMRHNAAYGALTMPFIRLSGAGVTTDTDTIADLDDTWQLVTVSGTPTEDGFCKVEFVCQSAGVGAAVYVDDAKMVYTAIDTGGMGFWYQGDMPPILMATGLGAIDVWDVLLTQAVNAGSFGLFVQSINAEIWDEVNGIEIGLTPRQAARLWSAALAGVLAGASTNTIAINNAVANTKARITATVDANGNRMLVVTDTV